MDAAMIFRYERPAIGREKLAFEAFQEALGFFGGKAAAGLCEAPVAYLPPSGGGMMIVGGDRTALAGIAEDEDFQRMYLKAGYAVPSLSFEIMAAGDEAVAQMGLWAGVGAELGLM